MTEKSEGISYDTKTIITVVTLIFVYPLGAVLMWIWMKWKVWVKLLVSLPFVLMFFFVIMGILAVGVNPKIQIKKAECVASCREEFPTEVTGYDACLSECIAAGQK